MEHSSYAADRNTQPKYATEIRNQNTLTLFVKGEVQITETCRVYRDVVERIKAKQSANHKAQVACGLSIIVCVASRVKAYLGQAVLLKGCTARHSTARRSTARHSTARHSTARRSTARHSTARHSTARHSTARHSTARHSTARHSTARHSTALHCRFAENCIFTCYPTRYKVHKAMVVRKINLAAPKKSAWFLFFIFLTDVLFYFRRLEKPVFHKVIQQKKQQQNCAQEQVAFSPGDDNMLHGETLATGLDTRYK